MGQVGGSRHYHAGGLGPIGAWDCPACGEPNTGSIDQGCASCGAGRPGRRAPEPATPPPAPPAPPPDIAQGDVATAWALRHPAATVEDAYRAGYLDGVRAARAAQAPPPETLAPEGKVNRTLIAALAFFRDQILLGNPEEIQTGEWMSAQEVTQLIETLQAREAIHA